MRLSTDLRTLRDDLIRIQGALLRIEKILKPKEPTFPSFVDPSLALTQGELHTRLTTMSEISKLKKRVEDLEQEVRDQGARQKRVRAWRASIALIEIRDLHQPMSTVIVTAEGKRSERCNECRNFYPCRTIKILDGD